MIKRLTKIDKDRIYLYQDLLVTDSVYYLHVYSPGQEYREKYYNPLILGVKNDRLRDLETAAENLADAMKKAIVFRNATIVPIPTSKVTTHRTDQMANMIKQRDRSSNYQVEPVIRLRHNTRSSHKSNQRLTKREIQDVWQLNAKQLSVNMSDTKKIVIFDDVLNHGTHFRVASDMIKERFPATIITGVFLAITYRKHPGIVVER